MYRAERHNKRLQRLRPPLNRSVNAAGLRTALWWCDLGAELPLVAGSSRADQRKNLNPALPDLGSQSRLERHRSPRAIKAASLQHIEWLVRPCVFPLLIHEFLITIRELVNCPPQFL